MHGTGYPAGKPQPNHPVEPAKHPSARHNPDRASLTHEDHMKRRTFLSTVTALLFAATTSLSPAAARAEALNIGAGVDAAYVTIFVAAQQGLFKKNDLDVTIIQYGQGGDGIDALVAGQIVMGSGAEPTTMIRTARAGVHAVAVLDESGKYIRLVARKGISKVEDIKTIGIAQGTASEYSVSRLIDQYKLDPAQIKIIAGAPPEFPALLARGDLDAYFLWEPWPTRGVEQGGTILMTSKDIGYTDSILLSANDAWFKDHQDVAQRVVQSLAEACAMIKADPAIGAAAVNKMTKIPVATALETMNLRQCNVRDFTDADHASYTAISKFLFEKGITKSEVDPAVFAPKGFYKP